MFGINFSKTTVFFHLCLMYGSLLHCFSIIQFCQLAHLGVCKFSNIAPFVFLDTWRKDVKSQDITDAINSAAPGKLRVISVTEVMFCSDFPTNH